MEASMSQGRQEGTPGESKWNKAVRAEHGCAGDGDGDGEGAGGTPWASRTLP